MAKAACVSIDLNTGEMLHQTFSTEEGCENPSLWAMSFWESVKKDFPTHHWALVEDDEAKAIRVKAQFKAWGMPENEDDTK